MTTVPCKGVGCKAMSPAEAPPRDLPGIGPGLVNTSASLR